MNYQSVDNIALSKNNNFVFIEHATLVEDTSEKLVYGFRYEDRFLNESKCAYPKLTFISISIEREYEFHRYEFVKTIYLKDSEGKVICEWSQNRLWFHDYIESAEYKRELKKLDKLQTIIRLSVDHFIEMPFGIYELEIYKQPQQNTKRQKIYYDIIGVECQYSFSGDEDEGFKEDFKDYDVRTNKTGKNVVDICLQNFTNTIIVCMKDKKLNKTYPLKRISMFCDIINADKNVCLFSLSTDAINYSHLMLYDNLWKNTYKLDCEYFDFEKCANIKLKIEYHSRYANKDVSLIVDTESQKYIYEYIEQSEDENDTSNDSSIEQKLIIDK